MKMQKVIDRQFVPAMESNIPGFVEGAIYNLIICRQLYPTLNYTKANEKMLTVSKENDILHLRYKAQEIWICSPCLPTLIHAPQKLAGKLENAEQIKPSPHKH